MVEGHMDDGLTMSRAQEEENKSARVIRKCTSLISRFVKYVNLAASVAGLIVETHGHHSRTDEKGSMVSDLLLIPQSHQAHSYYFLLDGLKLCVNYLNEHSMNYLNIV